MNDIGHRLEYLRETIHIDQAELGKTVDVSRNTVSRWERGHTFPSADVLAKIGEHYGVNIHWLVTGWGDPWSKDEQGAELAKQLLANPPSIPIQPDQSLSPEDFRLLPLLEGWIAAAPGGEVIYGGIADYYPFKAWWLDRLVGKNTARLKELFLVKVRGTSMSPTINPGEMIMVDTYESERTEIRTGQVYVVVQPDGTVVIKRLAISEKAGRVRLICMSDNVGEYKPFDFEIDPDKSILEHVIGRVRWAGKEFD